MENSTYHFTPNFNENERRLNYPVGFSLFNLWRNVQLQRCWFTSFAIEQRAHGALGPCVQAVDSRVCVGGSYA